MRDFVLMAGAGVSMEAPSLLPGWSALAKEVAGALSSRLSRSYSTMAWVGGVLPSLEQRREAGRIPPDYQAQLIEEMAGIRYFQALQSLDVTVGNRNHEAIAALARAGCLKAIVTTNFDRLIEKALERREVPFRVAFSDADFEAVASAKRSDHAPLQLIKIHGCVSSASSMIDTLKQRRRGRSGNLRTCLDALSPAHWIFAGFSAADIEADHEYLGFLNRARIDPSGTYICHPGSPHSAGAVLLRNAYAERWVEVERRISDALVERFSLTTGEPTWDPPTMTGYAEFRLQLSAWADGLTPAAAGLCIAALFEAAGDANVAARILDRLIRKELLTSEVRASPDYHACQLHYGRLGEAWGRFHAVPDLNQVESNASVESLQSLLRLQDTEYAFPAMTWASLAFLWRGAGGEAMRLGAELFNSLTSDTKSAHSREYLVDAWCALGQICIVNAGADTVQAAIATAAKARELARQCGDLVREGRVAALHLLLAAYCYCDWAEIASSYERLFAELERVQDGFTLGLQALAFGSWRLGVGGNDARAAGETAATALSALEDLKRAQAWLEEQTLDPWLTFLLLQVAKAYGDLDDEERRREALQSASTMIERFPVFASHFHEGLAALRTMYGHEDAQKSWIEAIDLAEMCGLLARAKLLMEKRLSSQSL